ncbi:hypothetical protein ES703_42335 [subsurface metagenome]
MPSIFKALASITVWVLFIWGCVTIVSATVGYYISIGIGAPTPAILMSWGVGTVQLILSVVAMKLRQMLE